MAISPSLYKDVTGSKLHQVYAAAYVLIYSENWRDFPKTFIYSVLVIILVWHAIVDTGPMTLLAKAEK